MINKKKPFYKIISLPALIFIAIVIVGFILRFYKLGDIPPGVNRDEAAIGYNAYSILTTGKDEYGRLLPLSFESFGDWKLPAYIYLSIPFIKLFGLSDISVRLLSAISGIMTVIMVYYLAKLLTGNRKVSLIAMFMLAITPWHIHFSRIAYEANLAVFFVTAGAVCLIKAVTDAQKSWLIIFTAVFWSISLYAYHGNHIFTLLLAFATVIIYFRQLSKNRYIIISLLIYSILGLLIFSVTLFGADKTKISGIGILGTPGIINEKIESPRNEHTDPDSFLARLNHNKYLFVVQTVFINYLSSFSPEFLFFRGGTNHSHNIEGIGNLYYPDALFLLAGLFVLLTGHKNSSNLLMIAWFLISPVAGSITKDAPHSARMFAVFPIISIISGIGINAIFSLKLTRRYLRVPKFGAITLFVILMGLGFLQYLDLYFFHFPKNEGRYWGDGYRQISRYVNSPLSAGKQFIFNHPEYSPYIFMLFYSGYSPEDYQKSAERYPPTADGFTHVRQFGRFWFLDNFPQNRAADSELVDLNMLDKIAAKDRNQKLHTFISGNYIFAQIIK
jgi:4-amino-4-deoxy-L-arabinose transferase-like glycosyltransferase